MSILPKGHSMVTIDEGKSSLVGKDVDAFCGKCQGNRRHTVVTVDDKSLPFYAQCQSCKSDHRYRAPKREASGSAAKRKEGGKVAEHEEEIDLDRVDVSRVFQPDEPVRKRAKAKAKSKKKDDDSVSVSKGGSALPLSMQSASPSDVAEYETRKLGFKGHPVTQKDYKITEKFAPGDVILHKTFGQGFVISESGLNKVEVLFSVGRKLLISGQK